MDSSFLNKAAAAFLLSVATAWFASVVGQAVVPVAAPARPVLSLPRLETLLIEPYMKQANAVRGSALVQDICSACHVLQNNVSQGVGPVLANVAGRGIASVPTYAYSSALMALRDHVWSDQNISDWLTAPARFAPGTRMSLMGLPSAQQRADIIAYLHTLK